MKTPCRYCERREVGCHAKCPDYISYKEELEEVNRKRHEEMAISSPTVSFTKGWSRHGRAEFNVICKRRNHI